MISDISLVLNNNVHQDKGPENGLIPIKGNKFTYVVADVSIMCLIKL